MTRRAKIVATLGPASRSEERLRELIRVGVDVFRFNLSHGSHEDHLETLERVRRVADEERRHVPVMFDLMGPRYRLGRLPDEGRHLAAGEVVTLGPGDAGVDLPIDDAEFLHHVEPGERVLIDSGLVELRVESKDGGRLTARVVNAGEVKTRKGLNLPDSSLPFEISDKDRADIEFAVREGADFLAASYVGEAAHVEAVREVARQAGRRLPVVAKLERATAVEHLDAIAAAADAVMVARGDLGVEVPLSTVPVLQKRIVAASRRAGRPVIVATQMLESMIEQPRPTRAEATDVANAVFDGADAVMLSGETAVGRYPVEAVATMVEIIEEAEGYERENREHAFQRPLADAVARRAFELDAAVAERVGGDVSADEPDVISAAAAYAAGELAATCIVAFSQSGFTARLIARYRPAVPIYAFTWDPQVARQLQLVWGVRPLVVVGGEIEHLDGLVQAVDRRLQEVGLAAAGDRIIIMMGHPFREHPLTNLMRVHHVRSIEEWQRLRST